MIEYKHRKTSDFGYCAEIEDHGEHHMCASHIRVSLDREFEGVKDFFSTNGNIAFSKEYRVAIVYDACIIILLNYETGKVYNFTPLGGCYISKPVFSGHGVVFDLVGSSCKQTQKFVLNFDSADFIPGLGKAKKGLLPSINIAYHRSIFH